MSGLGISGEVTGPGRAFCFYMLRILLISLLALTALKAQFSGASVSGKFGVIMVQNQ